MNMSELWIVRGYEVGRTVLDGHSMGRLHWPDASVGLKFHAVDAHLAMNARLLIGLNEVAVDAMIDDIPLISAWKANQRTMCGSVNALRRVLLQDDWIFRHADGSQGAG